MRNIRVIARLDVKGPDVINTIQLEGLRKVGSPNKLAKNYYNQGADELLIIDQVASLYQRDHLVELIKIEFFESLLYSFNIADPIPPEAPKIIIFIL